MANVRIALPLLLCTLGAPGSAGATPPPRFVVRDGDSSLSLRLAAQLRWETDWADPGEDGARVADSHTLFRRIRPTAGGSLLSHDTRWLLHQSTAPGSLELMDLWLDSASTTSCGPAWA